MADRPTVYLETTIPSYLTAWPSSDPKITDNQQSTKTWWRDSRGRYDLYISDVVVAEIGTGDATAATERLKVVDSLPRLAVSEAVRSLAVEYLQLLQIPPSSAPDAFHLALTVISDIDYLLTWNCKHLANPRVMRAITAENTRKGLFVPLILTPEELLVLEAHP